MADCQHTWQMFNVQFGFTVFEKCTHCQNIRTYFSLQDTWDEYREGECLWGIVENAQTARFDLQCSACEHIERFDDLLGLLYCTSCMEECKVEKIRKQLEAQRIWILVAFGYIPETLLKPISENRLQILSDYFNQRRDTSRSTIQILPFHLIETISLCRGEFIHDVGMLSLEAPAERKQLL
ncbi:MAG: hypothetical protein V1799_09125 [bacterium]